MPRARAPSVLILSHMLLENVPSSERDGRSRSEISGDRPCAFLRCIIAGGNGGLGICCTFLGLETG